MRDLLHMFKNNWLKENKPEEYKENLHIYYKYNLHDEIKQNVQWFAFHPKLYQNQNVFFQISISNITHRQMTLDEIIELKEKFNKIAIGIFGLHYDNCAEVILSDNYGHLYKFAVYKDKSTYEFTLWDDTGANHLYRFTTKNNLLTSDETNKIIKVMNNYRNHIINCSDCKKEIKDHEIAGKYFAGCYCKDCWEGKWKAIEAKENYN